MAKHYLPLQHVHKLLLRIRQPRNVYATVTLCALLCFHLTGATYAICNSSQFKCNDGHCISRDKICDDHFDCPDNSDELNCTAKFCHEPEWFKCTQSQGACLAADLQCNGIENCPAGEDELDCVSHLPVGSTDVGTGGWLSLQRNCSVFEYTCQIDKSCVPLNFMCDGKSDCKDASDEIAGCLKAEASCSGFFCTTSKKCLESKRWICDGVDDCGDGSDERNCLFNCKAEFGKYFCRDNSSCLTLDKVCDGKPDCADGSDEALRCTSTSDNCSTKVCPPASKCKMLPETGPECVCPKGYRHSPLSDACVDINECLEQYGLCSQRCENTAGSYRCTCDEGYMLRADNHTCVVEGAAEATLLYSTQVTVMGIHLRTKRVFTIAKNLTKVIGVAYDGDSYYWTNIQKEAESIVKAKPDSMKHEILLTSGLDAPEDLAVDWLTGNIYFSDNVMRHIAVCSNDGLYCNVLVTIDVHQPRGIALWPQHGQMFWTDWGIKPMIVRASMDGRNSLPIVTENIHWPNGIALDMHNNRVYWVDAKLATIESVRPNGSDRRLVLDDILKHPYGLAIFEDNIYWSDWATKSVHTCNKFTGKAHKVVAKDRTIYSVHIHHSAKQPKIAHACQNTRCSHLCLLAEDGDFSCACPENMQLWVDQHHCVKTHKKQRLYIGLKNSLLEMEHTTFGRHVISETHQLPVYVSEMVYNSVNGTIIVADNIQRKLHEYDSASKRMTTLVHGNLGNVTALAFDHLAHNVYWTDSERHAIEVLSLRTRHRAIISFFAGSEVPVGLSVIPDDGILFVALRSRNYVHIDQIALDGHGAHAHVFEDELGDDDIRFVPDYDTTTLYWADSDLGRISFSDYRNLHAYTFRSRLKRPYSIAIVDEELFWSELKSSTLYWTHKSNMGPMKRVEIAASEGLYAHSFPAQIPLLASTSASIADHPCQHANAGCSHICVALGKLATACLCPAGLVFKDASNRTCIEALDCEFRCHSGECLTYSHHCNGRKDCPDGTDEQGCESDNTKHTKVVCNIGQFSCHNGEQCIRNDKRCDGQRNCRDGTDEEHCEKFDKAKKCHRHQHACDNGNCVDFSAMCDGTDDCGDNSDESKCSTDDGKDADTRIVCDESMFQCNSGACIAKNWECDGKLDCVDASDEHEKCGVKECPADMHKCLLGQCIDTTLVCDGNNDCGDHSDELNCDFATGKKHNVSCGDEQHAMYQCPTNASVCLELNAKCNGTAECPRGEDEADCGAMCSIYEFHCKTSKECIRMEFRCDRDKDCNDGSDEINCPQGLNGTEMATHANERPCEAHMFDCKDGQCVDLTRVCDGFPDCETSADEGPLCKMSCRKGSSQSSCEHKCSPTPMGAVCSCFTGYRLDVDQRSCVDINECQESDPCAQICENTHGSYRCSCYPDFMLRTDKTTCKSMESESTLLFSTYNEVRSMSEQPIVLRVAWSANDSKITGFDVNVRQRLAYFSTDSENVLYMVEMESGIVKAGLSVDMPTKVAVDWITGNVYVISHRQRYEISVCSFAAKMCGHIIQASARESIKALNIDAFNRKLFYVAIRAQFLDMPTSKINIASPDGKNIDTLLVKNGGYITAIASDPFKKLLYFADIHTKTLQAISYKKGANRSPISILQKSNMLMHPSGLTLYENQAYIVNIGSKEALRCQLFGARNCNAFNLNILNAADIVVDGASRQPLTTDSCAMAKCSGMCIQAEYGYECMCGDAIVDEASVCSSKATNEITATATLTRMKAADSTQATSSHTSIIVWLSLLFVALLGISLGYMLFRRTKPGHRDLNINMHFQNPLASAPIHSEKSSLFNGEKNDAECGQTKYQDEYERSQLGLQLQRFFRSTTPNSGPEIMLTQTKSRDNRTLASIERKSSSMVEDDVDFDTPRTRHYNDDAHARLVP